ncbi:MAG: tRNA (adenine(22)-N(1))-methyltransferase [Butyricicoccus sp.]
MDNRMHLTPRLRTILELVPEGACLADIGTDHALIPVALLRRGRIARAIASDIGKGPLDSAARTARQFGVSDAVSLRLGAGLQTVKPEEADTIVIAGMGGETIIGILRDDPWALDGEHLLLLQAMTGQVELRQYLYAQGGVIEREVVCREGRRMYSVMAVRGGAQPKERPLAECCVSEALCRDKLAADYVMQKLAREEKICAALESAQKQKPEELALHRGYAQTLRAALEQMTEGAV